MAVATHRRILVVDDEWSMRELLADILRINGFEPILAADAGEFEKLVFENPPPDLIVLDIMLGEDDGTVVYQDLLRKGLSAQIPVIFVSALAKNRPASYPDPQHRYALLAKPFDLSEFARRLQEYFPDVSRAE